MGLAMHCMALHDIMHTIHACGRFACARRSQLLDLDLHDSVHVHDVHDGTVVAKASKGARGGLELRGACWYKTTLLGGTRYSWPCRRFRALSPFSIVEGGPHIAQPILLRKFFQKLRGRLVV